MVFRLFVLLLMLVLPRLAPATTFSTPLDSLVGPLDASFAERGRMAHFDFGQQFSSIQSVSIEVEARVFAEEYDVCGSVFDPQPCEHQIHLLGLGAIMDPQDRGVLLTIFTRPGLSFPAVDQGGREGYGTDIRSFSNGVIPVDWIFLLDGESSLTLYWNGEAGDPDRIIRNHVDQSGEIYSARLIIDGTPIPEPSTACLVALGLVFISCRGGRG